MSLIGTVWKSKDKRDNRLVKVVEDDGVPGGFVAVLAIDARMRLPLPNSKRSRIRKIGADRVSRYERAERGS